MRRVAVVLALTAGVIALLLWLVFQGPDVPTQPGPPGSVVEIDAETPTPVPERTRVRSGSAVDATQPIEPDAALDASAPVATGIVLAPDGTPVSGAEIVSHPDDIRGEVMADDVAAEGSRTFTSRSRDDGTFDLPVDPDGVSVILTATAEEGFGQAVVSPVDRTATVQMVPWRFVLGRVTTPDDAPVAGAEVTLHMIVDALRRDLHATTDGNGYYELDRVPPLGWGGVTNLPQAGIGRHGWLTVRAEGHAPVLLECNGKFASEVSIRLDVTLPDGMNVVGNVIDADTKQPIPGATVVCWSVEGAMGMSSSSGVSRRNPVGPRPLDRTRAGDDGAFRFEHLPAKGLSGVASHNTGRDGRVTMGHIAAWADGYVYGGDTIPVSEDGATFESTIELWPAAVVEGRVVDAAGDPIKGAKVYVTVDDRRPNVNGFPAFWGESREAWPSTDADGRYRFTGFRASRDAPTIGKLYAILRIGRAVVRAETLEITAMAGELVQAPDLVIDDALLPRATLLFIDSKGDPVPGATVDAQRGTLRADVLGRLDWVAASPLRTADALAPVKLVARAPGLAPKAIEFTPALGEPAEVVVLLGEGRRIAGRVTRADGQSVEHVRIVVADGERPVAEVLGSGPLLAGLGVRPGELKHYAIVTPAADGTFVALDLPDGPYHVAAEVASRAVRGSGQMPTMLRDVRSGVAPGDEDVVLVIPADDAPPTYPLDVVVTDAAGKPVALCTAHALLPGGKRLYAQRSAPGALRFGALPIGDVRIEVGAQGFASTVIDPFTIEIDGPSGPLSVTLDRGVVLTGTVRAATGDLPDSVSIYAQPVRGSGFGGTRHGKIAADGTYELPGLEPGVFRLIVIEAGRPRDHDTFLSDVDDVLTITARDRELTRDLVVQQAGELSFVVRDPRLPNSPFSSNATTVEQSAFGKSASLKITTPGGLEVAVISPLHADFGQTVVLVPGDYDVWLKFAGESPRITRVTVKAGERTPLRLGTE